MKILVTGATGFLGGWVLTGLSQEYGHSAVYGTGRNKKKAIELSGKGFSILPGDLLDKDFIKENFNGFTHVVHCAAKSSLWGSYNSFYEDNVLVTRNLLEGIPGLRHFIFISTPSIYFDFRDKFDIKENSVLPKKFVNHYATTKYLAEREVINFENTDMIRIVIRPRAIIGAGDTAIVPRLIRAYEAGRLKIIGDGKNICDFSSVKNIAEAVSLAIKSNKDINGKIFNITDDQPQELWPMVETSLRTLGFSPALKPVSYKLVFAIATLSEFFHKLFSGKEPVLTRYGIGVLKYSITLDISEAKKYLGYKPIITTEKSIDEFVKDYKNARKED